MKSIEQFVPLAGKTSLGIGGEARFYARARASQEAVESVGWARSRGIPVLVLGRGTNLLVSDKGWPGLVVDLSELTHVDRQGADAVCEGGVLLHSLVSDSVRRGYSDLARLGGIPGTIGGAVVMNAGAFGQSVSECISLVRGVDITDGGEWELKRDAMEFGYRTSSIGQKNSLVLSATFHFSMRDVHGARAALGETLRKREEKQPLDQPNCGSVFKRPAGGYAGALIEQCGLKGLCEGGAMVSTKHANFIVNVGMATAAQVRKLIVMIQKRVYRDTGTLLEPEVVFAGEFNLPLFAGEGSE